MIPRFIRTLRTETSERFVLQDDSCKDVAALDIHFFSNGEVSATLILLDDIISDSAVPKILAEIDEALLPSASFDDHRLQITVVRGAVVGSFEAALNTT